jgi:hypothetical protein
VRNSFMLTASPWGAGRPPHSTVNGNRKQAE